MRIALFGQTGQVATEVQRRVPDGTVLTVLGREAVDLADADAVFEMARSLRVDAVINAAAYTAVDRAENEETLARAVNAEAVGALGRALNETATPLVHLSTDYVFDGSGTTARMPDAPTGPLQVYGHTKLLGEELLRDSGARFAVLRTSWVFSAHGANFVKTMLRLGAERDQLSIVADQIGGPTPASAIADTCILVATALADGAPGGIYHYAGAPDASWADFARGIFKRSGLTPNVTDIETTDFPTPALRPLNSRLDCASMLSDFGIDRPDWRVGLAYVLKELGAT
jgi:dTDP-4-dehydrorhamnose reductase